MENVPFKLQVNGFQDSFVFSELEDQLLNIQGVEQVEINPIQNEILFKLAQPFWQDFEVLDAMRSAGVEPALDRGVLSIAGMHCMACVARVEGTLTDLLGVLEADVDLRGGEVTVLFFAGQVNEDDLHQAVIAAGYQVLADK